MRPRRPPLAGPAPLYLLIPRLSPQTLLLNAIVDSPNRHLVSMLIPMIPISMLSNLCFPFPVMNTKTTLLTMLIIKRVERIFFSIFFFLFPFTLATCFILCFHLLNLLCVLSSLSLGNRSFCFLFFFGGEESSPTSYVLRIECLYSIYKSYTQPVSQLSMNSECANHTQKSATQEEERNHCQLSYHISAEVSLSYLRNFFHRPQSFAT